MYRGKHTAQKRRRSFRKQFVALVSILVLILGVIGGTVAYLSDSKGPLTNEFEYVKVTCAVNECFEDGKKTDVSIQNTGDIDAYIRAAIIVTWKDENGNVYGRAPVAGTDYNINILTTDNGGEWTKSGEYYYCNSPVASKGATPVLISKCTEVTANRPAGYALSVEILADAIQSQPIGAVTEAWGYTPSGN